MMVPLSGSSPSDCEMGAQQNRPEKARQIYRRRKFTITFNSLADDHGVDHQAEKIKPI